MMGSGGWCDGLEVFGLDGWIGPREALLGREERFGGMVLIVSESLFRLRGGTYSAMRFKKQGMCLFKSLVDAKWRNKVEAEDV
jgi:hypothetical protein